MILISVRNGEGAMSPAYQSSLTDRKLPGGGFKDLKEMQRPKKKYDNSNAMNV
jgi:hypothetical protein